MNIQEEIIRILIERWNSTFGGISASEIADKLNVEHNIILKEVEYLKSIGKGKLNENVELYSISINIPDSSEEQKDVKLSKPRK
jgi:predicted transcriptional regulator